MHVEKRLFYCFYDGLFQTVRHIKPWFFLWPLRLVQLEMAYLEKGATTVSTALVLIAEF